jgi:hypothetical protein
MTRITNSRLNRRLLMTAGGIMLSIVATTTQGDVVDPAGTSLPNPNPKVIKNFGILPDGRTWGSTAGIEVGPDGQLWAYDRCGANACVGSNVDPIVRSIGRAGKCSHTSEAGSSSFHTAFTSIVTAMSG